MIRPMALADVPRVAEIHVFGWRTAFRGIVSDEILFGKRSVAGSMQRFKETLGSGEYGETYVFDDGLIKAFMTIGVCRDEDKQNAFELGGIYVEPLMKRQGIGASLVEFCEKIATERGYKEICLWVLEGNYNSQRFYEKMGFAADGTRKFLENIQATATRYVKLL